MIGANVFSTSACTADPLDLSKRFRGHISSNSSLLYKYICRTFSHDLVDFSIRISILGISQVL